MSADIHAMATVVMGIDVIASLCERFGKPAIARGMFRKAMADLNDRPWRIGKHASKRQLRRVGQGDVMNGFKRHFAI
jgi:hypothetical protein